MKTKQTTKDKKIKKRKGKCIDCGNPVSIRFVREGTKEAWSYLCKKCGLIIMKQDLK